MNDQEEVGIEVGELQEGPITSSPVVAAYAIDGVMVNMAVEIGRMDLPLKRLRGLRHGEVVALDRSVGDPVDVRINGKLIARGEVVAVDGRRYGVRLTEIAPSNDDHVKT